MNKLREDVHAPGRIAAARTALAVSRRARADDHVFILGGARSGSSLLFRLLQQHSSFRPLEPQLTESGVFNALLTRRSKTDQRRYWSLLNFAMGDQDEFDAFMRETALWRSLFDALAPIALYIKRTRSPRLWSALGGSIVLRDYFAHAAAARGVKRLVEKTPTHALHAWKLSAAFPNARCIYIARHPVDVFDSAVRRQRRDGTTGWLADDLDRFCTIYAEWDTNVAAALSDPRVTIKTIRYDDLSARAEPTLRDLLEFLGELWEPQLLTEVRAPSEATGLLVETPRENVVARSITDDDVRNIETTLAASMRRWGFVSRLGATQSPNTGADRRA